MPEVKAPYQPGTPCWVDLMVPDQQAALDFYRDLFGWQGEIGPPETGGYSVCTRNGHPVAGIGPVAAPDQPAAWTSYIASADAATVHSSVTAAGGTPLTEVMDVMTLGRMFLAADPAGAVFGVWQAKDFIGAGLVNEPGSLIWNECNSRGAEAASAFYAQVFGLTFTESESMPGYQEIKADGKLVGGLQQMKPPYFTPDTPSYWGVYFAVDNTDSTVDAAVKRNAVVVLPPTDSPVGRIATLRDPWGAQFSVITASQPG
ncbi:VOC family protein [Streptacidiphilus sp. 4-A2]|nr:VOC family protein [Streptacidiphilus sp. 4-A2]